MKLFSFFVTYFLLSLNIFAEAPKKKISTTKNTNKNNPVNKNPTDNKLTVPDKDKLDFENITSFDDLGFLIEKLRLANEYKHQKFSFEQFDSIEQRNLDIAILKYEYEKYSYEVDLLKLQVAKQLEEFKLAELNRIKKIEEYKCLSEEIIARQQMFSLQKEFDQRVVLQDSDKYLLNPILKNGNIRISDRKIYLNGEIDFCKANYVVDMINYYNNKSNKFPIFIFINDSFGEDVDAGGEILNAVCSSRAPVYVVVTGYAVSVAALIVTISERSFVLKEAVILHCLPRSPYLNKINLREAKDWVLWLGERAKRLTGLVAAKMGISLEEFIKCMYEKDTQGYWKEFGDNAVKLKWVTSLVNGIEDLSIDEKPVLDNYEKGDVLCLGGNCFLSEDLKNHDYFDAGLNYFNSEVKFKEGVAHAK